MWTDGPRRLVTAGLAAWLALALASCGEDAASRDLDLSGEATPTQGSDSPSPAPGSETPRPPGVPEPSAPPPRGEKVPDTDSRTYALELPEQASAAAVGRTIVDYMDVRVRAYNTGAVDLARISSVATGQPLSTVQQRVAELRQAGLRTVGDIWVSVSAADVRIRREVARFAEVCMLNASVDVDQQNRATENAPSSYLAAGRARRFGPDVWVIETIEFEPATDC